MTNGERAALRMALVDFQTEGTAEYVRLSLGTATVRERLPRHWAKIPREKQVALMTDQIKRLQEKLLRRVRNSQVRLAP